MFGPIYKFGFQEDNIFQQISFIYFNTLTHSLKSSKLIYATMRICFKKVSKEKWCYFGSTVFDAVELVQPTTFCSFHLNSLKGEGGRKRIDGTVSISFLDVNKFICIKILISKNQYNLVPTTTTKKKRSRYCDATA